MAIDRKDTIREWSEQRKWNPYNSYKLLAHVDRWRNIKIGQRIPAPVLITVDPANVCNLNCMWCNARYIMNQRHNMLSEGALNHIADFLPRWGHTGDYEPGVKAICVAGGGEPLLNSSTPSFIERVIGNDIEVGIVTNGTKINTCNDALSKCTWVGCSIDAGSRETFNLLKGLKKDDDTFSKIIDNIANLTHYIYTHDTQLGKSSPAYGVSYKYLIYKDNIKEVYKAARLAKEIGCKSIHFRPAGTSWDKLGSYSEIAFSDNDIEIWKDQIVKAQELEDENFGVFGVTHKFNAKLTKSNCFNECHAIFMTAVISPSINKSSYSDAFTMGCCCDRRGDERLELLQDCVDVEEIERVWGSDKHWGIFERIDVGKQCPRCTYQPHNQIYQEVIEKDSMTYKFI